MQNSFDSNRCQQVLLRSSVLSAVDPGFPIGGPFLVGTDAKTKELGPVGGAHTGGGAPGSATAYTMLFD